MSEAATTRRNVSQSLAAALVLSVAAGAAAQLPCATTIIEFDPAPGQWVNDPAFNDPQRALGWPAGTDPNDPGQLSSVSLGGFGGSLTVGFDHRVMDDAANPFGMDAIVFSNALWVAGDPSRHWAECATIEISRDDNGNGLADDAWYLIPGSHIGTPAHPAQYEIHTWDDDLTDATWPPLDPPADTTWIPPDRSGVWTTAGWRLPATIFEAMVVENPLGGTGDEGIWGYADYAPTMGLPAGATPEDFYTRPDNPFVVGITPGTGGGDAFDIAWAVDPQSWQPAALDGFDFIRLATAVNEVFILPPLGEFSSEIDAVVDVMPGQLGDSENDGDVDWEDWRLATSCFGGPTHAIAPSPCRVMDFDQDADLDVHDLAALQAAYTGPQP